MDYEMKSWSKDSPGIDFDLEIGQDDAELDLFISPFSSRQRAKPRDAEHVFGDFSSRPSKRVCLSTTNVELEDAETLFVSVHAYTERTEADTSSRPIPFLLRATVPTTEISNTEADVANAPLPDEVICKNCHQSIPKRTLPLHEAFCYRNNISCPHCAQVFLKNSPTWHWHWHCPHDPAFGNTPVSQRKHNAIYHPSNPQRCPSCDFLGPTLPALATHRTSSCPSKEILCQFCHLIVPQRGPDDPSFSDPEVLMSGLTPHELADGARTTECHLCDKIVRLRDMKTHLRLHDRDRISRPKPAVCSNRICGRTITTTAGGGGGQVARQLGLCDECFGPLYVTSYDPEGKALRRRVERRLLQQLMAGCGKAWCQNREFCRAARKHMTGVDKGMSAKAALPLVKPVLDGLDSGGALYFCVDEASQNRRMIAEATAERAGEDEYEVEWWVKALEEVRAGGKDAVEGQLQKAREWLVGRAPRRGELVRQVGR